MPKYKILIVDYEPRGIRQLATPLQNAGYDVTVRKDGVGGMEAFDDIRPDLAVLEAMLPKKNGFEACQELKKTPHGAKTPIIIVSSVYKGRKYRTQALHHYGCNEYLEKPVQPDTLLQAVERLLGASPGGAATLEAAAGTPAPEAPSAKPARQDEVEAEILSRLDELMPGDKGPSK